MSNDGYELDPEEARYLYGETKEKNNLLMKSLVMVNRLKKTKVTIELRDKDGDKVEIQDILDDICTYIHAQLSEESTQDNQIKDQVLPFVSMAAAYVISNQLPNELGAMILSNKDSRHAILFAMCCSFLILRVVHSKDLKIFTIEEPVSDEDIARMDQFSKLNEYVVAAHVMGISMDELFELLKENGKITDNEIEALKGSGNGIN